MKTIKSFLAICIMVFTFNTSSEAQSTQATNNITSGSYLGTSNNEDVIFQRASTFAGIISNSNSFFGKLSGTSDVDPNYVSNSAFGIEALSAFVPLQSYSVNHNSAFGSRALKNNLASGNSAFGAGAMFHNTSGINNVAVGYRAMSNVTSCNYNVGIGMEALQFNYTGENNIGLGYETMKNASGNNNIAIGKSSLINSTGNNNVALGFESGKVLTSGNKNTMLGYKSGQNVTTGSWNTIIGASIGFASTSSTPTVAGNDSNNTVVIGDSQGNQRIFVDNNGYTGIGLGNNIIPQNRLEIGTGISGTAGLRFRGIDSGSPTVASNGKVLTVDANGDVVLTTDEGGTGGGSNVNIYNSDGTIDTTISNGNNPNSGLRTVVMGNNNLFFDTSSSAFVDNTQGSGRIYIGNTLDLPNLLAPDSQYRLLVEGGILTEKVKVAIQGSANWADYVFEEDYELPSLHDVETYIKTNKHLPGIDSAESLVENGLDLAEMQAKQMEKIEELTLYVIEQDKKVKQQSKEIEELKAMVKDLLEQ